MYRIEWEGSCKAMGLVNKTCSVLKVKRYWEKTKKKETNFNLYRVVVIGFLNWKGFLLNHF